MACNKATGGSSKPTQNVARLVFSKPGRESPLSDTELVKLRDLLRQAERICCGCPMARHLLEKPG